MWAPTSNSRCPTHTKHTHTKLIFRSTTWQSSKTTTIPYIHESNPHPFYSFKGLKNQMRIRITCRFYSRSWAGFWKNDRAAVRAVRTIQYNNLLFIISYNIYNLLFIRFAIITHNWIVIRHPVIIISCGAFVPLAVKWPLHTRRTSQITVKALVTSNIVQSVCLVGKGRLQERSGLEQRTNFFFHFKKSAKTSAD